MNEILTRLAEGSELASFLLSRSPQINRGRAKVVVLDEEARQRALNKKFEQQAARWRSYNVAGGMSA